MGYRHHLASPNRFVALSSFPALLGWLAGLVALWRIPRCSRKRLRPRHSKCSVIIPARNEEGNLPKLLHSLSPQLRADDEIVVVDDGSTDATASIAKKAGVRVVQPGPHPAGWTGKTWACFRGASASRNPVLLFVDSDTWFAPGGFERVVAQYDHDGGMVTVQPFHCTNRSYEQLSAMFNLVQMIGVDAFSMGHVNKKPSGAFGPCIICARSDYEQTGGHERVKGHVLENFALGKAFIAAKKPLHCYGGTKTLYTRMYPGGIGELVEGWTKGIASGGMRSPLRATVFAMLWISEGFVTTLLVVTALATRRPRLLTGPGLLYLAYSLQLFHMVRRIGTFGFLGCLLFPVQLVFFCAVYGRSLYFQLYRKTVHWKGRTLAIERTQ